MDAIGDTAVAAVSPAADITALATERLQPVSYPVRLNNIAVMGQAGQWARNLLLRPTYGGRFLLLVYPEGNLSEDALIRQSVNFQAFNSRPELLEIRVPVELQVYRDWYWRLIKTHCANEKEEEYEEAEALYQNSPGLLGGRSARLLAQSAERRGELSRLVYDIEPTMEGRLSFREESDRDVAKLVAWSCHQPFQDKGPGAVLWKHSEAILEWYRSVVQSVDPHCVWALGDTSYSDGVHNLNFARQVDGKTAWFRNAGLRKDLLSLYRLCYRYHWSFEAMQAVMRDYPHLAMWDDHEIRDGYGSDEGDFIEENLAMRDIARQAAEEYLFQLSPRLRSEAGENADIDNHQAYLDSPLAAFIFDGRNSRNYGEDLLLPAEATFSSGYINSQRWSEPGQVVSDQQLDDFERFCGAVKNAADIKYLLMGNCVPFIYVGETLEALGSESALTKWMGHHDDIRDSWHSPANRRQLSRLIDILRDLHHSRPDMELINLSGDIHISNAFKFQPPGFEKPLYQVTSSALTNRPPIDEDISDWMSAGDGDEGSSESEILGTIERLWHQGKFQNFLSLSADQSALHIHLHVFNREDDRDFGERDIRLTIKPGAGYSLQK
ncbi:alkaline phosphatase D family protein [Microbulbifer halophilus]|uniref:Alkaline phosphatase D family protein n=1 Tax=Microbulbifer halophilus TaxID=453963 RepID=A0ABW5EDP4_9GAMM|nr:alkaline phosphatase D family protein [Microbulbifer halophilus]MCW8126371.1 alkaline phosphatase D family protein [Microbulbifer halophilus]